MSIKKNKKNFTRVRKINLKIQRKEANYIKNI